MLFRSIGGRNVSFPNYDESVFLSSGPLSDDDNELEAIWKKEHSLSEIIDRKNFKSYDELKKRLDEIMGVNDQITDSVTTKRKVVEDDVPFEDSKPVARKAPAPVVEDEEDDPDLAEFRKLIED